MTLSFPHFENLLIEFVSNEELIFKPHSYKNSDLKINFKNKKEFQKILNTRNGLIDAYLGEDVHIEGHILELIRVNFINNEKNSDLKKTFFSKQIPLPFPFHSPEGIFSYLDPRLLFSCGYYRSEHENLEQAQINKCQRLALKGLVNRNSRILLVQPGLGGFGLFLASQVGCSLDIENEASYNAFIQKRASQLRLDSQFHYQISQKKYDRIFIHEPHLKNILNDRSLKQYFQYLADDGLFILQTHTKSSENVFKDLFLEGEFPILSELIEDLDKAGFEIMDLESIREHELLTQMHWIEYLKKKEVRSALLYHGTMAAYLKSSLVNTYQLVLKKKGANVNWPQDYRKRLYL